MDRGEDKALARLRNSTIDFPWITAPRYSMQALLPDAEILCMAKGDILYDSDYDGRDVFIVRDGRIFNYFTTSHGHEKVVGVFTAGSLLGELRALDAGADFYTSQVCSENASVYKIPAARFLQAIEQDAELRMAVYESLAAKVRLMSRQIEYSVCTSALTKIAYLLLSACKYYGEPSERGQRIPLSFTHSEIARICGLSRVSASNKLQELRSCGAITQEDGHFVLCDLEYLLSLVE